MKTSIYLRRGSFLGNTFSKKGVIYIGVWAKDCQTPGETIPAELSELHFTTPEEQCGCILLLKKLSALCFFGFQVKHFRNFNKSVSASLWKLHFLFREEHFRWESSFIDFIKFYSYSVYDFKFFGVSAKIFRRGCNNCILQIHGKILRKENFLKVQCSLINFGLFEKNFESSSDICINALIYALYVWKWTFRSRNFAWKFCEFVCSSGLWAEKCSYDK